MYHFNIKIGEYISHFLNNSFCKALHIAYEFGISAACEIIRTRPLEP